jgi:hypothetical protein
MTIWVAFVLLVCLVLYEISLSVEIRGRVMMEQAEKADAPTFETSVMRFATNFIETSDRPKKSSKESTPAASPKVTTSTNTLPYQSSSFSDELKTYFHGLTEPSSETQWIHDYLIWHHDMRLQFPDMQLLDHPDAPPLMIAWYRSIHRGGLTDRTKCLGDLLQQAHQEKRIFLIKWFQAPQDIEAFLEPRLLNFTLPNHFTTTNSTILGDTYGSSIKKRQKKGQKVILTHLKQGCKFSFLSPFHVIWHVLFRPSPPVQQAIDTTMSSLKLRPEQFDAVHCRVTHPAFWGKTEFGAGLQAIDSHGAFEFEGDNKKKAIDAAIHGIQCASWISNNNNMTSAYTDKKKKGKNDVVYFFSDSQDLVRAMAEGENAKPNQQGGDLLIPEVSSLQSEVRIVGRPNAQVVHMLNTNENTPLDAFVSAFVDIYVASQARCLSLGVGNYAYLSAKIKSGPICWVRHQLPSENVASKWGMLGSTTEIPICAL